MWIVPFTHYVSAYLPAKSTGFQVYFPLFPFLLLIENLKFQSRVKDQITYTTGRRIALKIFIFIRLLATRLLAQGVKKITFFHPPPSYIPPYLPALFEYCSCNKYWCYTWKLYTTKTLNAGMKSSFRYDSQHRSFSQIIGTDIETPQMEIRFYFSLLKNPFFFEKKSWK